MLKQRILTALMIGLPLLVVLLFAPPMLTLLLFAAVVLLGAWEWSALSGLQKTPARAAYVLLIGLALLGLWQGLRSHPEFLPTVLQLTLLWWLLALLWMVLAPLRKSSLLSGAAGLMVLAPAWLCIVYVLMLGPAWVLFLLLLVVSADVGGFLFGRRFGHTKLAPQVSPGKTWEGVLGGLVLSMAVAGIGAWWLAQPAREFMVLCLITVLVSIVGDLTESLFKRHSGLKDSGSILPGHGGVLDRIDSIAAAAPVFLYGLSYLGVFAA